MFLFSPRSLGNDPIWLEHIFKMGWFNHQLARHNPPLLHTKKQKTSPNCSVKQPFFVKNLEPKKMVIYPLSSPHRPLKNPLNRNKLRLQDRSNHRGFVVLNLVSGVQTWNANPVGEAQLENKTRSSVGTGGVESEYDLPGINRVPKKKIGLKNLLDLESQKPSCLFFGV